MSEQLNLLYVEDDPKQSEAIIALLTANGYAVELATNGNMALHTINKHNPNHFSLVVTDLGLPMSMTGDEWVMNALETIPTFSGPVVFHSNTTNNPNWKSIEDKIRATGCKVISIEKGPRNPSPKEIEAAHNLLLQAMIQVLASEY
jgi:CheY-like chemotaxis protein